MTAAATLTAPFHLPLPSALAPLLRDALQRAPLKRTVPRPYIQTSSDHFRYALLRQLGYDRHAACAQLLIDSEIAVNPETARRWERALRVVARRYFGRATTYEFAARYATDASLRDAFDAAGNQLPENGH